MQSLAYDSFIRRSRETTAIGIFHTNSKRSPFCLVRKKISRVQGFSIMIYLNRKSFCSIPQCLWRCFLCCSFIGSCFSASGNKFDNVGCNRWLLIHGSAITLSDRGNRGWVIKLNVGLFASSQNLSANISTFDRWRIQISSQLNDHITSVWAHSVHCLCLWSLVISQQSNSRIIRKLGLIFFECILCWRNRLVFIENSHDSTDLFARDQHHFAV